MIYGEACFIFDTMARAIVLLRSVKLVMTSLVRWWKRLKKPRVETGVLWKKKDRKSSRALVIWDAYVQNCRLVLNLLVRLTPSWGLWSILRQKSYRFDGRCATHRGSNAIQQFSWSIRKNVDGWKNGRTRKSFIETYLDCCNKTGSKLVCQPEPFRHGRMQVKRAPAGPEN